MSVTLTDPSNRRTEQDTLSQGLANSDVNIGKHFRLGRTIGKIHVSLVCFALCGSLSLYFDCFTIYNSLLIFGISCF